MPGDCAKKSRKWNTIAWQGVGLKVPRDWSMRRFDGDARKGSFALDDGELLRLQVAWEYVGKRVRFERLVERFLAKLKRRNRREKKEIECRRKVPDVKMPGREGECFELIGGSAHAGYAMLSRCKRCDRVVALQATFLPGEDREHAASELFGSLTDHSTSGMVRWAVFGLDFSVPERFAFGFSELRAGKISLGMVHRDLELIAVRVSLAELLTRDKGLDGWFREAFRKELKRYRPEVKSLSFKSHPAVEYRDGPGLVKQPRVRWRRRQGLLCRVWHCEASDKLYVAEFKGPLLSREEFEKFARSFRCH